jgi:hypothetical protein
MAPSIEREQVMMEQDHAQREGRNWHLHKGIFLYVAGALAILLVGGFFKLVDLGTGKQVVLVILILNSLFQYWEREKQDRTDAKKLESR